MLCKVVVRWGWVAVLREGLGARGWGGGLVGGRVARLVEVPGGLRVGLEVPRLGGHLARRRLGSSSRRRLELVRGGLERRRNLSEGGLEGRELAREPLGVRHPGHCLDRPLVVGLVVVGVALANNNRRQEVSAGPQVGLAWPLRRLRVGLGPRLARRGLPLLVVVRRRLEVVLRWVVGWVV